MSVLPFEGTHDILYGSRAIQSGLSSRPAYLARPDALGAFPAVMVVADTIESWLKDLCRRLARHGYVAGAVPIGRRALHHLHGFLTSRDTPFVATVSPAVIAFGGGGTAALNFASANRPSGLVLVSTPLGEPAADLAVPTLGVFGREDEAAGAEAARRGRELAPHGEWVIYDGVGPDFFDEGSEGFTAAVADDAVERILGFLAGVFPRSV